MARKRIKPDFKFLPLQEDIPNSVPPVMAGKLAEITLPKQNETKAEKLIRLDRIIIFSEMIRDRWYSKFRYASRPKASEDQTGYKLKSRLFNATLDLIQEMYILDGIYSRGCNPLDWFFLIISELQIDALSFSAVSDIETKIQFRKLLQHQNRQIKSFENPFSYPDSPATYLFLERARVLAQSLDKFRENYYTPFRKAREALTTHLLDKALLYKENSGDFSANRQGRRVAKKINPYGERLSGEKI